MNEWLAVGLVITALILMVEHWFPVPIKLHVIANYTLGVLAILAGQSLWLVKMGNVDAAKYTWLFALVGGAAVTLCYAIDKVLNTWVRSKTNVSDIGIRQDPPTD